MTGRAACGWLSIAILALGLHGCTWGMNVESSRDGEGEGSVTMGPGAGGRRAAPPLDRREPPPVGLPSTLSLPETTEFRLDNGLEVVVVPRDQAPLVSVTLRFPGGASIVPPGKAGLAGLTADLLDEGSGARSGFEIADELDRLGASIRSYSSLDYNGLDLQALADRLDPALEIFAEVLLDPALAQEDLERLRTQQLNRILQSRDEPSSLADDAFARVLFGDRHPYGRPDLGREESIRELTRDDVVEFHSAQYVPFGAIMVVAGDVDPEEVESRVSDLLGGWGGGPAPYTDRVDPPDPPAAGPTIYIVDRPGAAQTEVRVGRVAVAAGDPDFFPLTVMNTVLGGSFTSRLNMSLREERGYSYGARSGFSNLRQPGPFTASSAVFTPVTDSAVVEIVRQIRRLSEEPVPEEELTRARNYVAYRLPQRFQTVRALASGVMDLHFLGLSPDLYDDFVDNVLAVTADDVRAVARRWLDVGEMAIVLAGDRAVIEADVRALGLGPVVLLPAPAASSNLEEVH